MGLSDSPRLYYFNPRAYVRHDEGMTARQRGAVHFNPRAYVRHDGEKTRIGAAEQYFNPRAYVRHDGVELQRRWDE